MYDKSTLVTGFHGFLGYLLGQIPTKREIREVQTRGESISREIFTGLRQKGIRTLRREDT